MPMHYAKRTTCPAALLAMLALAGCASDGSTVASTAPAAQPAPAKPAPPPVDMAGRWTLAAQGGSQCGMTFTAAAGASQGRIAPEGGCPGNFFTSRQWAFDQGALVIYDHKQQTLARLAMSQPPGQFAGTAASGMPVTLTR
jgi:hypothetical protein